MRKLEIHLLGIAFWIGGGVISIINIIKILATANILLYDYIMTGVAVIFVTLSLILHRKKYKRDNLNPKGKDKYTFGIGFWVGGGVYSLVNMIMNLKNVPKSNILYYNYLITGIAVLGLILNIILLKKRKNK
jgi:Flp pilus assembly protein protease CpaA